MISNTTTSGGWARCLAQDSVPSFTVFSLPKKNICFPLLNFGSIMTACYYNNKIIQEHQNNLKFMIPFAQESKTVIETNRIIKLKNCNFVNAEIIDS